MFRGIPTQLLLIGDFNARIGRDNDKWPLAMGKHVIRKCNSNGELLLALCCELELILTNTMFKQNDERKTTSRHWHIIYFNITRCRDKMDIHSNRAMRGANCWTDHQMLRGKVTFRIRQKHNRQGSSKPTKLKTAKLSTFSHSEVLSRRWTVLSPSGRRRKAQHQTRNEQLCSRLYTNSQQMYWHAIHKTPGLVRPQRLGTTYSYEQKKPSPPECCKPGALDPPLQHTKMPEDCYENAVHGMSTSVRRSIQLGGPGYDSY